jgi:hypothetical protein
MHYDHLIDSDKCHHQTIFNFGIGQTVVPAQVVQCNINQCKSKQWTISLSEPCTRQTRVNGPQVCRQFILPSYPDAKFLIALVRIRILSEVSQNSRHFQLFCNIYRVIIFHPHDKIINTVFSGILVLISR